MCKPWHAVSVHFFASCESHFEPFWKPGGRVYIYIRCAMFIVARASSRPGTRGLLEVTKAQGGSGPARRTPPPTVKQNWVNPKTRASCPAPHSQPKLCPTRNEPPAKPGLAASTPSRLAEAVGCSILVLVQPCCARLGWKDAWGAPAQEVLPFRGSPLPRAGGGSRQRTPSGYSPLQSLIWIAHCGAWPRKVLSERPLYAREPSRAGAEADRGCPQ